MSDVFPTDEKKRKRKRKRERARNRLIFIHFQKFVVLYIYIEYVKVDLPLCSPRKTNLYFRKGLLNSGLVIIFSKTL